MSVFTGIGKLLGRKKKLGDPVRLTSQEKTAITATIGSIVVSVIVAVITILISM